jgi:small-conductance mechanosensitive channel
MTVNYTFIAGFFSACLVLLFFLRWFLRNVEKKRQLSINEKEYRRAVPTDTPHNHPRQKARNIHRKSVRVRFSIIRHLATMLFILVVACAAVFPFLSRIPAALFSVVIASSGVVIGIAARPLIENLIAGIVITFSRPVTIGDTVQIDEFYGTIEDITPIHTIIKTWDWRRFVIPNGRMLSRDFVNLTLGDSYRWTYVEFWVAPDADLAAIKAEAIQLAGDCEHFSRQEPPEFWVMGVEKEATRCWLAAWADSPGDAWLLASEMRTAIAGHLRVMKVSRHSYHFDREMKENNRRGPG